MKLIIIFKPTAKFSTSVLAGRATIKAKITARLKSAKSNGLLLLMTFGMISPINSKAINAKILITCSGRKAALTAHQLATEKNAMFIALLNIRIVRRTRLVLSSKIPIHVLTVSFLSRKLWRSPDPKLNKAVSDPENKPDNPSELRRPHGYKVAGHGRSFSGAT